MLVNIGTLHTDTLLRQLIKIYTLDEISYSKYWIMCDFSQMFNFTWINNIPVLQVKLGIS